MKKGNAAIKQDSSCDVIKLIMVEQLKWFFQQIQTLKSELKWLC